MNTWRQEPEVAGGGFLFDTGAHMLNTCADIAGEDFLEVAAWLDNDGRPVDTRATVMGRLASGAYVTMHGCGEAIPSCASDVRIFCSKGILRTGIWGERLELQRRRQATAPAQGTCLTGRVGAIPVRAQRADAQSLPAGSGPADGATVGCDPHFSRPGRRTGAGISRSERGRLRTSRTGRSRHQGGTGTDMLDPQLENKVVLISGANHGIGAATAKAFAAEGAKVFITYYLEPAIHTAEELEKGRGRRGR